MEGDIVLIYYQDQPAVYARVEDISPDHKKDWYHVRLLVLTVPSQTVTWILREEYILGETFTMGGQSVRLEKVEGPSPAPPPENGEESGAEGVEKGAKVLPFKKS